MPSHSGLPSFTFVAENLDISGPAISASSLKLPILPFAAIQSPTSGELYKEEDSVVAVTSY